MNLKKLFSKSILLGIAMGLLATTAFNLVIGQQLSDDFLPLTRELIKVTDQANFPAAKALLRQWAAMEYGDTPALEAEYKYAQAYYHTAEGGDQKSYDLFSEAALLYEKLGNTSMVYLCEAFQLMNIYIMTRWEDTRKVGNNLLEKIPLSEKEPRAIVHNVLAAEYAGAQMIFEKSMFHGQRGIAIFKVLNNSRRLISIYGVLAACYNNQGDFETALEYIDTAQTYAEKLNNQQELAFLKIRKGRAFFNAGNDEEGVKNMKEAANYFIQFPSLMGQIDLIYGQLSLHYAKKGQYKLAYEYRDKREKVAAERRIAENDKATNDLMVKYETEKKERQLEIQTLNLKTSQQKFNNLLLLATAILIILILSFFLFYNRFKNRQQEALRIKEVNFQKNLLDAAIEAQEEERKRISKDLHDGIGQQLSGLKFSLEQYDKNNSNGKGVSKFIDILKDASTEVRNISHSMMPRSLQALGLNAALYDMLEKAFEDSSMQVNFDTIGEAIKLSESVTLGVYRIVQELINNIIKHSKATEIDLHLAMKADKLLLMLEENGKGFIVKDQNNLGHGLSNIQTRVQVLNGKVNFEKKSTGGMLTTLTIPLTPITV